MRLRNVFGFTAVLVGLIGCATSHKNDEFTKLKKVRVEKIKLEIEIAQSHKRILELKNENTILLQALENKKTRFPKAADNANEYAAPITSYNEEMLYKRAQDAFENKDEAGFLSMKKLIFKIFPRGNRIADLIYMSGMFDFESTRWNQALNEFDLIVLKYPNSHRVTEALLGKAMIFKKLNQEAKAEATFQQVRKRTQAQSLVEKGIRKQ